jgi:hypothetical protein
MAGHSHGTTRVLALDVLTADAHESAIDLIAGESFGVLDRTRDRPYGLIDVDHYGLLEPAGRDHAFAYDGKSAITGNFADESAHLARADIDSDEHCFAFHSLPILGDGPDLEALSEWPADDAAIANPVAT